MQKQISDYIGKFLSPVLWGYRKGFSTQHASLMLIERWKFCLDKLKPFDSINHEPLIANFHMYGFSVETLEALLSYL